MQKQHRVSDRTVWHVSVQNELVIEKNPLVEGPQAITNGKQHPERSASQRIPDCVGNDETGRQEQQQKITDAAVCQQGRVRFCGERHKGSHEQDGNEHRWPEKSSYPYLQVRGEPFYFHNRPFPSMESVIQTSTRPRLLGRAPEQLISCKVYTRLRLYGFNPLGNVKNPRRSRNRSHPQQHERAFQTTTQG